MTPSSLLPAQAPEPRARCHGGAACNSVKPWPLHHVWNGSALHLCTSCVLRLLPAAFCFICLDPVNISSPSTSSSSPLARCLKCLAVAHEACLSTSHASAVLCPVCSTPHRSFFYYPPDHRPLSASRCYTVNLRSAKALLTASQLAAASINYAADVTRSESERKVFESAAARKRARKKIESFLKKEAKNGNKLLGALALTAKKSAEDKEAPTVNGFASNWKEEKCGIEVKGSENGVKEEQETDNWMHQLSRNSISRCGGAKGKQWGYTFGGRH